MSEQTQVIDWKKLIARAGPYPPAAFDFVREGLNFTVGRIHEDPSSLDEHERHINGRQLSMGLRDYAIDRYGLLAPTVLSHWHIHRTEDFGRIVFAMVDCGLLSKTDNDTLEDFRSVYDFDEAFSMDVLASRVAIAPSN